MSISSDDNNLQTTKYNLVSAENLADTKRGGVYISYQNPLPLQVHWHSIFKSMYKFWNKTWRKCLCLHRSPSPTRDIFETFADKFELPYTLELPDTYQKKPFSVVALGKNN